jgi:hypothetical protein
MAVDCLHENEREIKAIFEEHKIEWRRAYSTDDHKVSEHFEIIKLKIVY